MYAWHEELPVAGQFSALNVTPEEQLTSSFRCLNRCLN